MLDFTGKGRKMVPVAAKGVKYLDKQWCIVNKDTINLDKVAPDLEYACYHGDCTAMKGDSRCSKLDKIQNISYAFNMYYQIQGQDVRACDFKGAARITKDNATVEVACSLFRSLVEVTTSGSALCSEDSLPLDLFF